MISVLGMSVIGMAGTALGEDAIKLYRTQPKNAVGPLIELRRRHPQIKYALMTMEADALLAKGDTHRALRRAQSIIDNDERWAPRARWVGAQASVETDCRLALSFLDGLKADPPWYRSEQILSLRAKAHRLCGDVEASDSARRTLALTYPHTPAGRSAGLDIAWTASEHMKMARAFEDARAYSKAQSKPVEHPKRVMVSRRSSFWLGSNWKD